MMILDDMKKCTGCEACTNICPVSCISMKEYKDGFLYPEIDNELCLECGLCKKSCPIYSSCFIENQNFSIYACMALDDDIRKESSSGGVFRLLSEQIIKKGGVVFGAYFDDDFFVKHGWVDNFLELDKLMKSKYVQSYIGDSYKKARVFLNEGRIVLFSGTPCQIAGLKKYLDKEYDNLICLDVVCFGVPSPLVFNKYIKAIELSQKSKITKINFRNKESGWTGRKFSIKIEFENKGSLYELANDNLYQKSFYNGCNVRLSCYNCPYKNGYRISDITIADYWGVENYSPDMDDGKGTTLVIINNEKGYLLFETIKKISKCKKVDKEIAFLDNVAAIQSKKANRNREKFFIEIVEDKDNINTLGILYKYTHIKIIKRILLSLRRRLFNLLHIRKVEV